MLSIGCKTSSTANNETDDYLLEPIRPDDNRLISEEINLMIDDIHSTDVLDMAEGENALRFVVELPEAAVALFVKSSLWNLG